MFKMKFSVIVMILSLVMCIGSAWATDFYVRTDGNDSNDGSANDAAHAWLTIQHAVNTVLSGDVINVAAGTYPENVTINKNLTLCGSGNPNATSFTLTNGAVVSASSGITAATVNIDQKGAIGAKIQDGVLLVSSGGTVNVLAGTYAENVIIAKSLKLRGINAPVLDKSMGDGVKVSGASAVATITGFIVQNYVNGILVESSGKATINNCEITDNTTHGVYNTTGSSIDAENNYWGSDGTGTDIGKPGVGGNNDATANVDFTPWARKGNVTATGTDYGYNTLGGASDDITLNFGTLPPGGGWVSVSREDADPGIPSGDLPDGVTASDVVPISLSFFSDMVNGTFDVTITITGVDITGFTAADLYVAYYSTTSEEWILVPCTVTGSGTSGTIEFTINHFTDIVIVDPENPIHIFLDGDPSSEATEAAYDDLIYPTWTSARPAGSPNDDGYYESGNATVYVTPGVYAPHGIAALDFKIIFDKNKLTMGTPEYGDLFASGLFLYNSTFSGDNQIVTFQTSDVSSTVDEGDTTDGKLYVAKIPFTLANPGYGEVSLEVISVRYFNTTDLRQYELAKTSHNSTFKFYLGDVGDGGFTNPNTGDGLIEGYDMNLFTTSYWSVSPAGLFCNKCDIGPTEDSWVFTFPTDGIDASANGGDGIIEFEDLCIFSITWSYSHSGGYAKLLPISNTPVNIWAENKDDGEYTYLPVRVDAHDVQLRAGSFTIETPGYELVEVIPGELLKREESIFIESRQREGFVDVDLAVIGHQTEPINDEGTLFTLKLRGNGVTSVSNVILRDMGNNDVPFVLNKEEVTALPSEFALIGATPNPFNATTAINFSVPYEAKVRIEIHDLTGRTIATLCDDEFETGLHSIIWGGLDNSGGTVSSGTYIVRMSAEDFSTSSRITLIK